MQSHIVSVVGGSGFLGRYVVKRLAEAGYSVRVLCRHPQEAEKLKPAGNVGQIVPDYIDVTRPDTIRGKFDHSFAVVNLPGILYESGKQQFSRIHAQGAEKIAQEAKAAGVSRLVHVSALGIDKSERSIYARTKLEGERAVRATFPDATILRPGLLFGAEDHFFNRFARMGVLVFALPAIGGGKTRFQPVYVDDVAKTVLAAILSDQHMGKLYELGGPRIYTFRELLQYIGDVTGRERALLSIPYPVASLMGTVAQWLPNPPLTHDQVRQLKSDNIVSDGAEGFDAIGIIPTSIESIVPGYLAYLCKAA